MGIETLQQGPWGTSADDIQEAVVASVQMSLLKNPTVGLAVVNPVAENQIVVGSRAAAGNPPPVVSLPAARSLLPVVSLTAAENLFVAEALPAAVSLAVVGNLLAVESLTAVASLLVAECLLVAVESLAAAANLITQSSTAESPTVESLVASAFINIQYLSIRIQYFNIWKNYIIR